MKKSLIFIVLSFVLMTLVGCSKDSADVNTPPEKNEVALIPINSEAETMRTKGYVESSSFVETYYSTLHSSPEKKLRTMQLSAFLTPQNGDQKTYFVNKTYSARSNDLAETLWWNTNSVGGEHDPIYWPVGGTLDFLAYSVSSEKSGAGKSYNVNAVWNNENAAHSVVLTVPGENTQNDILFSSAYHVSSSKVAAPVNMTFNHSQAWLEFVLSGSVDSENPDGIVTLRRIELEDVYNAGVLTISNNMGNATAKWDFSDEEKQNIVVDNFNTNNKLSGSLTYLDMLIPQQKKTAFVIYYTLGSSDKELSYRFTTDQKTWLMGEKYTYKINITTSEVTVFPSVSIWQSESGFNYLVKTKSNDETLGTASFADGATEKNFDVWGAVDQIKATAKEEYIFLRWDDGNTNNPRDITVTDNATYTAIFCEKVNLVVKSNDEEMGTVEGSGEYAPGTTAVIKATPKTHYQFVQWQDGNTDPEREIVVPEAELVEYEATFAPIMFNVRVESLHPDKGEVTGAEETVYMEGTELTLKAVPFDHNHFVKWSDDVTESERNITVIEDIFLYASFDVTTKTISVKVSTGCEGMGRVEGGGPSCEEGKEVTLTAIPEYGYEFDSWNGTITDNPFTFTVEDDKEYVATFKPVKFTITPVSEDTSKGTVSAAVTGDYKTTATIKATPATYYKFTNWTNAAGVAVSSDPEYVVTIERDSTLTAHFAQNVFTISATVSPSGTGEVTGTGEFGAGAAVKLEAVPADHYQFKQWGDGTTTNPLEFTATEDKSVTAVFEKITYDVTVAVATGQESYGSVSPSGKATRDDGSTVDLVASANANYEFDYWDCDGVKIEGATSTYKLTVSKAATYSAHFKPKKYTVTVSVATGQSTYGSVDGGGDYDYGSSQSISATASTGYHFVEWDDTNTDNPRTITIEGTKTYTATFAPNPYTVTAKVKDGQSSYGTAEVVGGGTNRDFGTKVTIKATPNTGYDFVKWSDSSTEKEHEVTVGVENNEYTAEFKVNEYLITVKVKDGQSSYGEVSGGGTYSYGSTQTIKATPKTGYHFVKWVEDSNTSAERTVTVGAADATYTAEFAIDTFEITATSEDTNKGTVTGGNTYNYNSTAKLTATPKDHYVFDYWDCGGTKVDGAGNPYEFTVTAAAAYKAHFKLASYALTVNVKSGQSDYGSVSGGNTYEYGTDVEISATANEGYAFVKWNDGDTNAKRTVKVTEAKTYTAEFEKLIKITVTSNNTDMGTVTGGGYYKSGASVTITAAPNSSETTAYYFNRWSDDSDDNESLSRTFNATADATYTAEFIPIRFTVGTDKQILFAPGNLQAELKRNFGTNVNNGATPSDASNIVFKFAEHQYDVIGAYDGNLSLANGTTIDLFNWSSTESTVNYWGIGLGGDNTCGTSTDPSSFNDWGKMIGDGDTWRTPTVGELNYILFTRSVNGSSGPGVTYTYSPHDDMIQIGGNGYDGLFIYPDGYRGKPVGDESMDTWDEINTAGIIFLPDGGFTDPSTSGGNRPGHNVETKLSRQLGTGGYWAATPSETDSSEAQGMKLYKILSSGVFDEHARAHGYSVRLVKDLE